LRAYWSGDAADYLSRALLRPYVEALSRLETPPDRTLIAGASTRCRFCKSPPWIALRRSLPDSDGAARYLCCALCGREEQFLRIRCPGCAETDPARLPSFRSEQYPAARIEACETCKRYVKSIDLTLDARPIAEVDDLATLALDLWAQDEGYTRLEPGLAGI